MSKDFLKYSLVIIFVLLVILPAPEETKGACTTGPARATGLITSPSLMGPFSTSSGACVIDPKSAPFLPFRMPAYEDLKSLYFDQARSTSVNRHADLTGDKTQNDIPMTGTTDNLYHVTGNLSITGNISGNRTGVVFVDKNLNLGPISGSKLTFGNNNSGLVFVAKGDVNIDPSITQIDAVIISSGTIYTAGAGCSTNTVVSSTPLTINGSLVMINDQTKIKFCRIIIGATIQPAEIINHQPKYLVILRNAYSDTLQRWSEVQ